MEDEWTVDANEALNISLVRPTSSGLDTVASFNPKFTYPIFGDDERIFGHKGLKVNLQYDARDLRPNLSVSSSRKFTAVGDIEPLDVRATLKEFLPGVAFQSKKEYDQALKSLPDTWAPPGTLLKTFNKDGATYEIWHGTLDDPAVFQLVRRIQITVLFFIEGGSYIVEDEPDKSSPRWSVFFVYRRELDSEANSKPQYTFQGYATTYKFWMYQQPTPPASPILSYGGARLTGKEADDSWNLPDEDDPNYEMVHRMRISQFIILPSFQGKGIGAFLYNTIFEAATRSQATKEVTVEDPNEDFDLLRDLCDLKYMRKNVPEFLDLQVNTDVAIPQKGGLLHHGTQISPTEADVSSEGIVDIIKLEDLRIKNKIAPRQFWRLIEMHLMSKLPESVRPQSDADAKKPTASKADKHAYTLWRLLLKQRLYRRNKSVLGEFEITERILKLNETLNNVEWEYARILDRVESKPVVTLDVVVANGKRKLDGDNHSEGSTSKKARVEEEDV
ncbi:acyl-CoA N-acyltransferase [Hypoxylon trugodes]|uniref:acyl-CoA N-acyltransferase n=1 Tax=Hypoxylon trugodes TaxID=326681 RepID=UPI00218CE939|nr:acyl-CoA N-acyltransferase [Hypoxylon trugodes]KAI1384444.1 acyl-CoA N-acyltransferase [Hypoxylon trugodes]